MIKHKYEKFHLKDNWANAFYNNANEAFENLYYGLCTEGDEISPRGIKVRETLGCNIYILNPNDNLVYNPVFPAAPRYIAHETAWYYSADNSVESIGKYSKFWYNIANEDGTVNSNYGCYIFRRDETGVSEWEKLVERMKKDPDTRQAILQIPVMQFMDTKDVTCTMSLQFFLRHNKLFMTTYMRSNDIVRGFRNDIPFFTGLQMKLAEELGVELGWYRHVVGSLHVYETHFMSEDQKREFMSASYPDAKIWKSYSEMSLDIACVHLGYEDKVCHNDIYKDLLNISRQ